MDLKVDRRLQKDIESIDAIYSEYYPKWHFSDRFKVITLRRFLTLLPIHEVTDALYIAIGRFPTNSDRALKYFCGVCWTKIRSRENG